MAEDKALTPRRQRLLVVVIALASFMGALDATIVNISLPAISASFGARLGLVSWVIIGYLLVLSASLLLFGRLGDLHGFRPVFLGGFLVFTAGSLLCGLSGEVTHLIGFRVLQGAGAAALQALGPALIALNLPKENRGRALGILATATSLGIAGGPIIGHFRGSRSGHAHTRMLLAALFADPDAWCATTLADAGVMWPLAAPRPARLVHA